jgi:hypothetical protein
MSKPVSLLFICENFGACSAFQKYLEREGCRLTVAVNTESATRGLLASRIIDAVLIHDDNSVRGNTLASGLKFISPRTPVLMVCSRWPGKVTCHSGLDALFQTSSFNRRVANDLANLIRCLIAEKSLHLVREPTYGVRPLVPHARTYVTEPLCPLSNSSGRAGAARLSSEKNSSCGTRFDGSRS